MRLRRRRVAASSSRAAIGMPSTITSPPSALSSPAIRLSSVDLPTPDSPMMATNSPAAKVCDRPFKTLRPLYVLVRPRSSSMVGWLVGEGAPQRETDAIDGGHQQQHGDDDG